MSSSASRAPGGDQRGQRGTRRRNRVGGGREQGEVLGQRTGGERRRAAVRRASSTSRRPSTNRPRTDRPTTSRTASRGRPSASPRARARRNEASESPSTPLATSLSPAASAGPAKTSVSPSSAQDLVDLGGRLAAGEDRQPAGGDGRGRPHDRRVQVRRPGRRHQGVQRLRLVRSDRRGVHDGRPGGQRGQDRGEHVAAGRAVVQAEEHHVGTVDGCSGRAAAAPGPGTDVVEVGEAGGHGRAHPAEAEDGNRGHAHQRGSTPRHATSADQAWLAMRFRHDGSMSLTPWNAFVEVCRTGSIRAAAEATGFTQPGLSRQVAALEREVGVRLLHRGSRGVDADGGRRRAAPPRPAAGQRGAARTRGRAHRHRQTGHDRARCGAVGDGGAGPSSHREAPRRRRSRGHDRLPDHPRARTHGRRSRARRGRGHRRAARPPPRPGAPRDPPRRRRGGRHRGARAPRSPEPTGSASSASPTRPGSRTTPARR